jgi:uncharacterized integral membrane protein
VNFINNLPEPQLKGKRYKSKKNRSLQLKPITQNMNVLSNLLISLVLAIAIALLALLSVQNATLVSVQFLNLHSIDLPWGLVLAIFVGIGLILAGCLPLLGIENRKQNR